jgi:hypothetical protein
VNFLEKTWQDVDRVDKDQVVERSRVGDNQPHLATKAQSAKGGALPLEVFEGEIEPNFVGLEKAVELGARFEAKELTHLRFGEPTRLVLFECQGFECTAREITSDRGKALGDIVGNV